MKSKNTSWQIGIIILFSFLIFCSDQFFRAIVLIRPAPHVSLAGILGAGLLATFIISFHRWTVKYEGAAGPSLIFILGTSIVASLQIVCAPYYTIQLVEPTLIPRPTDVGLYQLAAIGYHGLVLIVIGLVGRKLWRLVPSKLQADPKSMDLALAAYFIAASLYTLAIHHVVILDGSSAIEALQAGVKTPFSAWQPEY